ncbi:nuclear transport factor 2 family protein [Caulobacter sp. NIBR2454]|uniref:nuclear transport factor 2 family protein n=1 Tax=Caulobacter sp. NIBR2454 TaxID=3015996 RepID=UPI0022B72CA9|nr:nuclear transport factor 2 family protein [Caulobacter sp. NIBR2454]
MFKIILAAALAAPTLALALPAEQVSPETVRAIEAVAYDYLDGQLEGDPARVARALHPDLAKRAIKPTDRDEVLPLRRMSKDELVSLTADGVLKTPREKWDRQVKVVEVDANIAMARVETPWFIDYFHLGRFGDRWVIVNALWYSKPRQAAPAN